MQILVIGHTLNFFDCCEIGQGGPEACSLSLDGFPIPKWSFDPSPLEYRGTVLIPVRKGGFWGLGYALARIDPSTRKVSVISKVWGYMKLLRIEGNTVVFATTTYGPETGSLDLS